RAEAGHRSPSSPASAPWPTPELPQKRARIRTGTSARYSLVGGLEPSKLHSTFGAGLEPGESSSASVRSCCSCTSRVSQHTISREGIDGYRNRQVVQRRQGLRLHHARRLEQGPVRSPQRDSGERL